MFGNDSTLSSFKLTIFLTLILLNLFSECSLFFNNVIKTELPSDIKFLHFSNTSEKINNSNTPVKSVSLITAYVFPLLVFLSCIFRRVAATLVSLISFSDLNLLKSIIS